MLLDLVAPPHVAAVLGESGLGIVRARMSDAVGECLSCARPLAGTPTSVSIDRFPNQYLLVRAHHAHCPEPPIGVSSTYVMSALGVHGMALLLVHPSAEMLWLRQDTAPDGGTGDWMDTTATGFTDIGFARGVAGQSAMAPPTVPNATIQLTGNQVTVDLPPSHRWTTEIIPPVAAMLRQHGVALVVVSTATDQQNLDTKKLNALFTAGDYVAGVVDHAPIGRARSTRARDQVRHPMFLTGSPEVNARTVFLDDPEVGWAAARVDHAAGLLHAGIDIDRIPMVLLETPLSITLDVEGSRDDHLVETMIEDGMHRIGEAPGPMNVLPGWDMTYDAGEIRLRSPSGAVIVGAVTPEPQWLSAALGHGAVVALYGPVLGVRDSAEEGEGDFDPPQRRAELLAARKAGMVAGGMIAFRRGRQG